MPISNAEAAYQGMVIGLGLQTEERATSFLENPTFKQWRKRAEAIRRQAEQSPNPTQEINTQSFVLAAQIYQPEKFAKHSL